MSPEPDEPDWPTGVAGTPGQVHFRHVGSDEAPQTSRFREWRVFLVLLVVLAVASVALVVTSVIAQPPAPKPCHDLFRCGGGPVVRQGVVSGTTYTSSEYGFSIEYGPNSGVQTSPSGVIIQYVSNDSADQGQVQIFGTAANSMSAAQLVTSVQQSLDPNAQPEYAAPNPFVGFQPGAGEAYNYVVNGSNNTQELGRMIILAAVRSNLGIVVVASGPFIQFSNSNGTIMGVNDHPSPADVYSALFADPVINSVAWPG